MLTLFGVAVHCRADEVPLSSGAESGIGIHGAIDNGSADETSLTLKVYDMADVSFKVGAIINAKLHISDASGEDYVLRMSSEYLALRSKCSADWSRIVTHLESLRGGDDAKILVIQACEDLSPGDYMAALEGLVSKYEANMFPEGVLLQLVFPGGRMGDFFTDNYAHARMIALIGRIKAKGTSASLGVELDSILAGTSKQVLDNFRETYAGRDAGLLPAVILPP